MNRCVAVLVMTVGLFACASSVGAHTEAKAARNGPLTIFSDRLPVASIDTVGVARSTTLWRCPHNIWCGEEVSFDWARRAALRAYARRDRRHERVRSRAARDRRRLGARRSNPEWCAAKTIGKSWLRYRQKMLARLGCWPATDLAWSPDGSRLAFRCPANGWQHANAPSRDQIHVIAINGRGYRVIPTPTAAFWPSWSPDGTRIGYSTNLTPRGHPSVLAVALDGSHRRLVATDAAAPSWSPDGKAIAYQTACGVRLVTPTGKDRQREGDCGIGRSGRPVWSPDGSKLAIEAGTGIYELNADVSGYRLVTRRTSTSHYGQQPGRPSWRPLP
jgi:hypothetical protein